MAHEKTPIEPFEDPTTTPTQYGSCVTLAYRMAHEMACYRVSASVIGDCLRVSFADGVSGSVALSQIEPRRGEPDWSALANQMKGAHVAVPVSGGEDEQHEVPWDVLRSFCDPGFEPLSASQPEISKSK